MERRWWIPAWCGWWPAMQVPDQYSEKKFTVWAWESRHWVMHPRNHGKSYASKWTNAVGEWHKLTQCHFIYNEVISFSCRLTRKTSAIIRKLYFHLYSLKLSRIKVWRHWLTISHVIHTLNLSSFAGDYLAKRFPSSKTVIITSIRYLAWPIKPWNNLRTPNTVYV